MRGGGGEQGAGGTRRAAPAAGELGPGPGGRPTNGRCALCPPGATGASSLSPTSFSAGLPLRSSQDKLAKLQAVQERVGPAGAGQLPASAGAAQGSPLLADGGAGACTPPAAMRAAALERQLLEMEAGPASPTQLLLPPWPEQAGVEAPRASAPLQPRLTSAELRRELRRAVAGEQGGPGAGSCVGTAAGGEAAAAAAAAAQTAAPAGAVRASLVGGPAWPSSAADLHHLLHPSPMAASHTWRSQPRQQHGVHQQLARAPLQGPPLAGAAAVTACSATLLASRDEGPADGPSLLRTCSDPGDLLAAFAAMPAMPALPVGHAGPRAGSSNNPPTWLLPGLVA